MDGAKEVELSNTLFKKKKQAEIGWKNSYQGLYILNSNLIRSLYNVCDSLQCPFKVCAAL